MYSLGRILLRGVNIQPGLYSHRFSIDVKVSDARMYLKKIHYSLGIKSSRVDHMQEYSDGLILSKLS